MPNVVRSTIAPENVVIPPGAVAARILVELLPALVVLDDVAVSPLLDVHAFVAVWRHGVAAHHVVGG